MSRDLSKAHPFLQEFVPLVISTMKTGYGGREDLLTTNRLRKAASLPAITEDQNRRKITWTMNSKHIVNKEDTDPFNDLSRAIDFGLLDINGKYHGESQADLNGDSKHDYEQLGAIIEVKGKGKVKWGGRFGDEPHMEMV
jgi:hypothetical protein